MQIYLGPAGSPAKSTLEGIKAVADMKLSAMEVEFVRGVKMSNQLAAQVGQEAKKYNVKLSVHGPYYINLSSVDKAKIEASKKRILDSCERAYYLGAEYVVFHPGYYGKRSKEETYEIIKNNIFDLQSMIKNKEWKVKLATETTGKVNVFGSVDEILQLVEDTECSFCLDFAHLYARNQGKIDYSQLLDKFKKFKYLHCHFSGINYTSKGERNHLDMNSHPPFEPLAKEILKRNLNVTIISESPNTWQDSLKQKKIFEGLGYKF